MSADIDGPIVLPEKVSMGSKYFETEVQSLREAVSEYLRTGVCITHRASKDCRVLRSPGTIQQLCKEIAKERDAPFVEMYWYAESGAVLNIPHSSKTMPLLSMPRLVGHRITNEHQCKQHDISVFSNTVRTKVYFNGLKGLEALRAWMSASQTDNKLRMALGLPPKVNPSAHAVRS